MKYAWLPGAASKKSKEKKVLYFNQQFFLPEKNTNLLKKSDYSLLYKPR